jgi:hypothetical protein
MEGVADHIIITGQKIKESLKENPEHPDMTPLRKLNRYCSFQLLRSSDMYERFLCFSIANLIDAIFFNLAGDTPYDKEVEKARISLFEKIPESFEKIGNKIGEEKHEEAFIVFSKLVSDFADRINFLNLTKEF